MIHVTSGQVGKFLLLWVLIPGLAIFFHLTRFNYVPVQVTIGACQKDYTSPSSYKERVSPLAGHSFDVNGWDMLVCYGQPSLKGRDMLGGEIPYDQLWRFGANEPTRFYTTADMVLGDLVLTKGRYSLYAIPGQREWEIFVNRDISHWGNDLSPSVRSKEVGSFKVRPEYIRPAVEVMTLTSEEVEVEDGSGKVQLAHGVEVDTGGSKQYATNLIFMWQNTRLTIPIENLEKENKRESTLKGQIEQQSKELNRLEEETGTKAEDINDILNRN